MPLHHKVTPHPPPLHQALLTIGKGEWLCSYPLCATETAVKHVQLWASNVKDLNPIFDCLIQLYLFILFCILTPWKNLTEVWKLVHYISFMANISYQIISFKNFQSTNGKQLVNRGEFLFRWGFSPLDEAVRFDHQACVDLIKHHLQLRGKTIQ